MNRRFAAVRGLFEYAAITGARADNPVPPGRRSTGLPAPDEGCSATSDRTGRVPRTPRAPGPRVARERRSRGRLQVPRRPGPAPRPRHQRPAQRPTSASPASRDGPARRAPLATPPACRPRACARPGARWRSDSSTPARTCWWRCSPSMSSSRCLHHPSRCFSFRWGRTVPKTAPSSPATVPRPLVTRVLSRGGP